MVNSPIRCGHVAIAHAQYARILVAPSRGELIVACWQIDIFTLVPAVILATFSVFLVSMSTGESAPTGEPSRDVQDSTQ